MTTAGERLRAKYTEALARASRESNRTLEWTESEASALERAVASADEAERVKVLLDAEHARPEPRTTVLTKLSAEWRLLNKAAMDYEWRLNLGVGQAKNPAKVRAGQARWSRQPAMDA